MLDLCCASIVQLNFHSCACVEQLFSVCCPSVERILRICCASVVHVFWFCYKCVVRVYCASAVRGRVFCASCPSLGPRCATVVGLLWHCFASVGMFFCFVRLFWDFCASIVPYVWVCAVFCVCVRCVERMLAVCFTSDVRVLYTCWACVVLLLYIHYCASVARLSYEYCASVQLIFGYVLCFHDFVVLFACCASVVRVWCVLCDCSTSVLLLLCWVLCNFSPSFALLRICSAYVWIYVLHVLHAFVIHVLYMFVLCAC